MATTVYADSGDGTVRNVAVGSTSGSWTTLRNASSGSSVNNAGSSIWIAYADDRSGDSSQYIFRSFFSFSLSGLPSGATVTAATLNLYGVAGGGSGAGGSLAPYSGSQASTSTLATSDFSAVGSTAYATGINFSSWSTAGYNSFTLNSTGLAALESAAGSTVKLSFRSSFDASDSKPTANQWSGCLAYTTEQTGTSNDPYLSFSYSLSKTTSDSWAWSDTAVKSTAALASSDSWAWSDVAARSSSRSRAASDAWGWYDRAERIGASSTTVNASAGDGHLTNFGGTWSTVHDATIGSGVNTSATTGYLTYLDAGSGGDPNFYIYRCFLPFSLTGVSDDNILGSGTVYVYVSALSNTLAGDDTLHLVVADQASASTLTTADYPRVTTSPASDYKPRVADITTGWLAFPLNRAGMDQVLSGNRLARFAVRHSRDVLDSSPTRGDGADSITIHLSENATNKPYLALTYDTDTSIRPRYTSDAWAWSDTAAASYVVNVSSEQVLFPKGPYGTAACTLSSSVNFASLSTLALAYIPTDAPSAGEVVVQTAAGQRAVTVSYTGITGGGGSSGTLTGCASWKSSGTISSGTRVRWANAEKNFPSIASLPATSTYPYGRLYATCTQHCSDNVEGTSNGKMIAKYSDNGGYSWSSETVIATPVNSDYGIWGTTTQAFPNGTLWVSWYEHNVDYNNVKSYSKYSTDGGVTFSSPVEVPGSVFSAGCTFLCVGGSGIVDPDNPTHLYVPFYGIDLADLPATTTPYPGYNVILKSTDYGATWTKQGTISKTATGSRGTTEAAMTTLADGSWIIVMRQEVGSTPGDTLDRYRLFSSDKGATWTGGGTIVSNLSNWCNVIRSLDNVLLTQGQYEASPVGPRTYYSYNNGSTFATYDSSRLGADGLLGYYVGADQENVQIPSGQYRVAFIRGLQGVAGDGLETAQSYFSWYATPPVTTDTWAWTDSAAVTARGYAKATSDSWAWSDSASKTQSFSRTGYNFFGSFNYDFWSWSDAVERVIVTPLPRSTNDAWAWSDSASGSVSHAAQSRTTSDALAWSDAAVGDVLLIEHSWIRAAADTWTWADDATRSLVPFVAAASGLITGVSFDSVTGASVKFDSVVDASISFRTVV